MNEQIEKASNARTQILIVEDSPTQAMELQYMLEEQGYTLLLAPNGAEALTLIGRHRPPIVISDIIMPEMDGYELCRRIKADVSLRDTFVILLTSLSEAQDVIKGLQCGADRFLTKPYDEDLLLSAIDQLLRTKKMPEATEVSKPIEVSYKGKGYSINSSRSQILGLLISTYEAAVKKTSELAKAQAQLRELNRSLEDKVRERTADLQAKNEELNMVSQQLWQAAKLATMGELTASIAHELNNPLATVKLRIESLQMQVPPDNPMQRPLEIIEHEVTRMGNLVTNLLVFGRRHQREVSTVNIGEEIDNTLELINYHLRKYGTEVIKEVPPDIPHIHADRQQLRQLFLNLFTNSSDSMTGGGTLTLRVRSEGVEGEAEGQTLVAVEIIDTGAGIPPEIMPRIMEPFYTTKPEGKGTGLGLPICRRIVQEHGGTLQIESVAGKGTTVCIRLPVTSSSGRAVFTETEGD